MTVYGVLSHLEETDKKTCLRQSWISGNIYGLPKISSV